MLLEDRMLRTNLSAGPSLCFPSDCPACLAGPRRRQSWIKSFITNCKGEWCIESVCQANQNPELLVLRIVALSRIQRLPNNLTDFWATSSFTSSSKPSYSSFSFSIISGVPDSRNALFISLHSVYQCALASIWFQSSQPHSGTILKDYRPYVSGKYRLVITTVCFPSGINRCATKPIYDSIVLLVHQSRTIIV